jgi:molecular chaperone GrpE
MASTAWDRQEDAPDTRDAGSRLFTRQPADSGGEVEQLREALRQEHDRYLRMLADFTNYRRRIEGEGNRLAEAGKREMILPLLGVVDDLERALERSCEVDHPVSNGVRIVHQKLLALLHAEGILPFDSVGEPFTPERHEAVAVRAREGIEPGIVVEDLRRGYLWKDELLRPAQVCVAP